MFCFLGSSGFKFAGKCLHNVFENLSMSNTDSSMLHAIDPRGEFSRNQVVRSTFTSTARNGIRGINVDCAVAEGNLFAQNYFRNLVTGVFVGANVVDTTIVDNYVRDTSAPGIYIETKKVGSSTTNRNLVARNLVANSGDNCIQVVSFTDVVANVVANCDNRGIDVRGENVTLEFNTVYADPSAHIAVSVTAVESNVVRNNLLVGGSLYCKPCEQLGALDANVTIVDPTSSVAADSNASSLFAAGALVPLPPLATRGQSTAFDVAALALHPANDAALPLSTPVSSSSSLVDFECQRVAAPRHVGALQTSSTTRTIGATKAIACVLPCDGDSVARMTTTSSPMSLSSSLVTRNDNVSTIVGAVIGSSTKSNITVL